ncbi:hypothetical protein BGZ65_007977, partial [Modicella reniformis]
IKDALIKSRVQLDIHNDLHLLFFLSQATEAAVFILWYLRFQDLIETYEDILKENESDDYFTKVYPKAKENKDLRFQVASTIHRERSDVPFYVSPRSNHNQFRPIFANKDAILKAGTVDVERIKEHERKQPKSGPTSKTGKRTVKAKTKKSNKRKGALPGKTGPTGPTADPSNPTPSSATVRSRRLSKKHVTKTLTVGSIRANIKRFTNISERESKLLSDRLESCIQTLQMMQVHAYEAIALDIATIVGPNYATTSDSQAEGAISSSTTTYGTPASGSR